MIDQQVPGESCNPGLETSLGEIECRQVAVNFQEDFLRQILGVVRRAGKAVAKSVNAAMVRLDQLRPCHRIAVEAPPYNQLPVRVQMSFPWSVCRPAYPARNSGALRRQPWLRRRRPLIHVSRYRPGHAPSIPSYGAGCAHAREYAGKRDSVPVRRGCLKRSCLKGHEKGCPILSRFLRKGGKEESQPGGAEGVAPEAAEKGVALKEWRFSRRGTILSARQRFSAPANCSHTAKPSFCSPRGIFKRHPPSRTSNQKTMSFAEPHI